MKKVSGKILELFGWKLTGEYPDVKQSVIVFAPHTSNWDYVIGKLFFHEKEIETKILMKKELFVFPLNLFFDAVGGIPVDRKHKSNMVKEVVGLFKENEQFNLVISAEGTRNKTSNWKKGFYHIANQADVPIIISYINYKNKTVGLDGLMLKHENLDMAMSELSNYYKNIPGKYENKFALNQSTINN